MILLLDQGNSRLKWAVADEAGAIVARGLAGGADTLADALGAWQRGTVERCAIASVASIRTAALLADVVHDLLGVQATTLATRARGGGVVNGYTDPSRLGVDRWLALVGARAAFSEASLVVDAGTALTVDALTADGKHLGGYIVPGYRTQLAALAQGTAGVGMSAEHALAGWGTTTAAAVANGVAAMLAALVERASIELADSVGDTCRVVLTGGDATLLASRISRDVTVDPDLVFRGMLVELDAAGRG